MRFVTVNNRITARLTSQPGAWGSHSWTSPAAATVSSATTITQKYQYIQPVTKPASSPTRGRSLHASRAYS